MSSSWDDSRRAFRDAAEGFVRTAALVGDRWSRPGLGEWDVRALVGHTSRSLLTVETYLARPAPSVEVASAGAYFRATSAAAAAPAVAARGRGAGTALGGDPAAARAAIAAGGGAGGAVGGGPAAAVAGIAGRVLPLVGSRDGTELVTTIPGGIALPDY